MAIAYAIDRGHSVEVYDENGACTFCIPTSEPNSLAGYTNSTVTVRSYHCIDVYDEQGAIIRSIPT